MTRTFRSNLASGLSPRPYIELMKPRIVILLVFTCVTSMIVAIDSFPPVDVVLPTILGVCFPRAAPARSISIWTANSMPKWRAPLAVRYHPVAYRRGTQWLLAWLSFFLRC